MIDINKNALEQLSGILDRKGLNIVLVGHTNPDGDAVGSVLAWGSVLESQGHNVSFVVPNRFPSFLDWLEGIDKMLMFKFNQAEVSAAVAAADVIFCMDFNQIARLEMLSDLIESNTKATKILIDHHPEPPQIYDLQFSYTTASSTSYIVYNLIEKIYGTGVITKGIAEAIYVGMMTDTGNFSFGNLTPGLFRALATLAEREIDIPAIHVHVYNSYSGERMRLLGYVLNDKMQVIDKHSVAYIALSEEELKQYNFQIGDTEGFVNYPLTIKGMRMSAMFTQNSRFIRISLRSRGDIDVNLFARKYFEGGGHKNAAGGKAFMTMQQTIDKFIAAVDEYFS